MHLLGLECQCMQVSRYIREREKFGRSGGDGGGEGGSTGGVRR